MCKALSTFVMCSTIKWVSISFDIITNCLLKLKMLSVLYCSISKDGSRCCCCCCCDSCDCCDSCCGSCGFLLVVCCGIWILGKRSVVGGEVGDAGEIIRNSSSIRSSDDG